MGRRRLFQLREEIVSALSLPLSCDHVRIASLFLPSPPASTGRQRSDPFLVDEGQEIAARNPEGNENRQIVVGSLLIEMPRFFFALVGSVFSSALSSDIYLSFLANGFNPFREDRHGISVSFADELTRA